MVPFVSAECSCRAVRCSAAVFAGGDADVNVCAAFLPCRAIESVVGENTAEGRVAIGVGAVFCCAWTVPVPAVPAGAFGAEVERAE